VLVYNETGQIFVTGSRFASPEEINKMEARAVHLALDAFRDKIRALRTLHLFIDNTSAMHSIRRGMTRSESLVNDIAAVWRKVIDMRIELTVDYVSTDVNPADAISRARPLDPELLQRAMRSAPKHATGQNFVCS
jgi:hypothetical protein